MTLADRFRLVWTPFIKKHRAGLLQAVALVCPSANGCGGQWRLNVGGRKYEASALDLLRYPAPGWDKGDPPTYLWLIPRPDKPVRVRAEWRPALGGVYRDAITLTPADPRQVHVVFKTHIDLGYTDTRDGVLDLYRTSMMRDLLERLDSTAVRKPGKRFVWTLSTWLLEQLLDAKKVKPDYVKRLEKHIRGGQVVWGLMPFTTHSEFFGLEEMCRSLYGARRLAERYKVPVPTAAKMTDVPAHTMALGMAFAQAGGRFFQIGTNPDCRPPKVPPLFWWEFPDNKRLLVHYHSTYGTQLLPPATWPWDHWLSVQITSDNVGPQSLELLRHIDWIDAHFDWPRCTTGRLEDFSDGIIRAHDDELPDIDEELIDWWIHGIGSQAGPTALARRTKDRLPAAETLATLAGLAQGKALSVGQREAIAKAYENLSLYTEHTWGDHVTDARKVLPKGNRYTSSLFASDKTKPPVDRWVKSWQDKARYATDAHEGAHAIERDAVGAFAREVAGKKGDQGIMLLNPLAKPRSGVVKMADTDLPAGDFELVDPTTGGIVLYERHGGRIEFVAPPVPACGYLVLEVRPVSQRTRPGRSADWDQRQLTLHADEYSLQFHTEGGLARWHDRSRSTQWCSVNAEFPMGTYLYEMPGWEKMRDFARATHTQNWEDVIGYFNRQEYRDMSQFGPVGGAPAKVKPEITPLYARVTVEANCPVRKVPKRRSGDARRCRTTFTHYRGHREVYVNMQLLGKRATYAAEAGYGYFSFGCENPWIAVDRISNLIDPAEELPAGVNAGHMAVHRGVRIEGQYAGVNFYPLDTPLLSFNGKPGAWRFDEDGSYETGVIHATLFNNCWGTNFAQWQAGDFSYDFVIQPTGDDDWDGGLADAGSEFFRPLVASAVRGVKDRPSGSLVRVESRYVQLVALKSAEFGKGTVLRLWNADCDTGVAKLSFPGMGKQVKLQRCDLLERPKGKPTAVKGVGETTIRLEPHEVATFLVRGVR